MSGTNSLLGLFLFLTLSSFSNVVPVSSLASSSATTAFGVSPSASASMTRTFTRSNGRRRVIFHAPLPVVASAPASAFPRPQALHATKIDDMVVEVEVEDDTEPAVQTMASLSAATSIDDMAAEVIVEDDTDPAVRMIASLSTATDVAASTTTATVTTLAPPEDWAPLWKRRLVTHEDPWSVHKLASIIYTLSGTGILATAAARFATSPEMFAEIPSALFLPTYAFTASNIVMCVASIRMAWSHRRYDLTARNAFLGTAASSLFSGFYYLWTNPLGPDIFNNQLVTQACFATLLLLNVVLILDTCFRVEEVVEGRRDGKAEDYEGRKWIDALAYVFPVAWGLPFVLATGWVDAVLFNREWFFQQCLYIDQQTGAPGMQANLCYLQVLTSFGPAFGALFVTLRDKKLITKQQEVTGITIFSVPALIWTIWVTATFFKYTSWE